MQGKKTNDMLCACVLKVRRCTGAAYMVGKYWCHHEITNTMQSPGSSRAAVGGYWKEQLLASVSFSITPDLPHRTNCKPRPSQPGHAPITVRPICQQNFHDHPFWIRHHLSLSPLPCPTPPTPTSPIASVSPHLSVLSHSRPTRRPSRSMRPGRGFTGTGDPFGKGSSQSLPGSRGQSNHQHPPQRSQPGPHQPAR